MDLVTLIAACALNVEPKLMQALIWRQSGGEPWSFSVPGESTPRVLPTLQDAVREARAAHPEFDGIRVGLTGLSTHTRSVRTVMFAPCPNVTVAARKLTELAARCNTTSKPDPTYCAIAAYRGSWDRPDIGFADAVRATVEEGNTPNVDLPKDAYFDASDIASDITTRKPLAAPSTPGSQSDDRTYGWSSALFPISSTKPNGTSAGKQNGDQLAEEPQCQKQARHQSTVCLCRDHPSGGRNGQPGAFSWNFGPCRTFDGEARGSRVPDRTMAR
jgi:hypothetical protein